MDGSAQAAAVFAVVLTFVIVAVILLLRCVRTIRPYEQGVVTILGLYRRTLSPGFQLVGPLDVVVRVDLRPQTAMLPPYGSPSGDGTPITVSARADYRIVNAARSVFQTPSVGDALQRSMKEAVSDAVSRTSKETVGANGGSIAREARDRTATLSESFGVAVECVTVTIQGPGGPMEFFSRSGSEASPPLPG
jgi:regulator of protease activity HflC (stomatin/prohibitin superfamily)